MENNAKLFSSSPELLKQQLDFIKYFLNTPTLSMPLLKQVLEFVYQLKKSVIFV